MVLQGVHLIPHRIHLGLGDYKTAGCGFWKNFSLHSCCLSIFSENDFISNKQNHLGDAEVGIICEPKTGSIYHIYAIPNGTSEFFFQFFLNYHQDTYISTSPHYNEIPHTPTCIAYFFISIQAVM